LIFIDPSAWFDPFDYFDEAPFGRLRTGSTGRLRTGSTGKLRTSFLFSV